MKADCLSKETVDLHVDLVVAALHYPGSLPDCLTDFGDLLPDALQVAVPPTRELYACVCLPLAEYVELRVVIELAGVAEVGHSRLVADTRQGEGEAVAVGLEDDPVE